MSLFVKESFHSKTISSAHLGVQYCSPVLSVKARKPLFSVVPAAPMVLVHAPMRTMLESVVNVSVGQFAEAA